MLKGAGLVIDKRAGKQRIYQVDPDGLAALRAELDRFWTKILTTYKTVVEQPTRSRLSSAADGQLLPLAQAVDDAPEVTAPDQANSFTSSNNIQERR